jgi:hypothetical protein
VDSGGGVKFIYIDYRGTMMLGRASLISIPPFLELSLSARKPSPTGIGRDDVRGR